MAISSAIIDAMLASGCTAEQLAAVIKADNAEQERRAARQIPWATLRAMAFERDGEICGYCQTEEGPFEVDHIIPRAAGGEDVLENVVVACRSCNRAKKDRQGDDWESLRERRRRDRDRKRESRGRGRKSVNVTRTNADKSDTPPNKEIPPKPPKEINPPISPVISNEMTPPSAVLAENDDDPLTVDELVSDWNDLAKQCGLPTVAKLTDSRRRRAQARIRQYPEVEAWQRAFASIRGSPWLQGQNDRGWRADFDFLLQDKSFTKLVEGSYGQA